MKQKSCKADSRCSAIVVREQPGAKARYLLKILRHPFVPSCIISSPLMFPWNRILMRTIVLFIFAGSLFFNNVWADHEADHRYNIRGHVLDAKQRGIEDLTVQAFKEGKLLETSKTDADGYYSLHLHLHNEDFHRIIKLRAGSYQADVKITFDPNDDTSARIHDANFVDGEYVEGNLGRFRIPSWSYVVGGLLLFMMILIFLERRRKKKIRLAKYGKSEVNHPSKHKARKSRRKKH